MSKECGDRCTCDWLLSEAGWQHGIGHSVESPELGLCLKCSNTDLAGFAGIEQETACERAPQWAQSGHFSWVWTVSVTLSGSGKRLNLRGALLSEALWPPSGLVPFLPLAGTQWIPVQGAPGEAGNVTPSQWSWHLRGVSRKRKSLEDPRDAALMVAGKAEGTTVLSDDTC